MKSQPAFISAFAVALFAVDFCLADKLLDFESDTVGMRPADWTFDGDSSTVLVVAKDPSGDYPGGVAIDTDESGASFAGYPYAGPEITSIQADFLWNFEGINDPTLFVFAWDDTDGDGYQNGDQVLGFGLDNDGQFELYSGAGEISGGVNFAGNTWYRLTMSWGAPDASGNREVTLSAFDLTSSTDLGVVNAATLSAVDFGVDPSEWGGVAFRMTRGTIDNIRVTSAPGAFTYVDADPSNTTLNSDPENFPGGVPLVAGTNFIDDGTNGTVGDNLWTFRTDAAFSSFENGSAFESDPGSGTGDAEITPDLITTISLPTAGTYDLVAVFTRKNNRDLAARLGAAPDSGDIFDGTRSLVADQTTDPLEIEFDASFSNSRGDNSGVGHLGTVTTTSNHEEVRVFINGLERSVETGDERTQYEGIGYRLISTFVVPPMLVDFNFSEVDGSAQVSIKGAAGTRYKLVEADDLDFMNPNQDPVPLTGATVGVLDGDEVVADANGDATVQFILGTSKEASFIRAVSVP